jgi:hypothetical protein
MAGTPVLDRHVETDPRGGITKATDSPLSLCVLENRYVSNPAG